MELVGPLFDHLENFLDGAHTHFVHAGIIRIDRDRQRVTATRRRIEAGVEVRYDGEGKQNGFVSRFFEVRRDVSFGRYRFPAAAEVEYRAGDRVTYAQTNWYIPRDDGVDARSATTLFSIVSTPRGLIPGFVKRLSMAPVYALVMRQDARIVARTAAHHARAGRPPHVDTPNDLFAGPLRAALDRGAVPDADACAASVELDL
jgi:hypothetical protein